VVRTIKSTITECHTNMVGAWGFELQTSVRVNARSRAVDV